jgi:hypothetical protein
MNIEEHYWNTFTQINEWIRFADTKAGALITLNSIIIGFIASNLKTVTDAISISDCLIALSVLGSLSLIISLLFALKCILPNLSVGEPKSNIFFKHISKKYSNAQEFKEQLTTSTDTIDDLKTQIWANSRVADNKYSAVNKSIIAFSFLIGFSILIIFIELFNYS